ERRPGRSRVGEAVRARRHALVPGGEHHVLSTAARVERRPRLQSDDEGGAAYVVRDEDGLGEPLPASAVVDDEEPPRLAVARASGDSPGLEDLPLRLRRKRLPSVAARIALAGDGEERVHGANGRRLLGDRAPRRGTGPEGGGPLA